MNFKSKFIELWMVLSGRGSTKQIFEILTKFSSYFRGLDSKQQEAFIFRVRLFVRSMEYKALGNHKMTREMKYLIASGFVQITFGLKPLKFNHFYKILVCPKAYRYLGFKSALLGHVDYKNHLITLSWENSKIGFQIEDDAHNAVLHEMAHAIEFENRKWLKQFYYSKAKRFMHLLYNKEKYLLFDESLYQQWLVLVRKEMKSIKLEKDYFLKQYAAKNIHEYFACAVEAFFETPKPMRAALPDVYKLLTQLLNQDPLDQSKPRLN